MDEARRFLRYVIPGLLFITETVLFFRIIFKRWPTSELPPTSDIGLALGTALGAAAVGFMLSMGTIG